MVSSCIIYEISNCEVSYMSMTNCIDPGMSFVDLAVNEEASGVYGMVTLDDLAFLVDQDKV